MTDRPSAEDGLRIAAARAGQQDGDESEGGPGGFDGGGTDSSDDDGGGTWGAKRPARAPTSGRGGRHRDASNLAPSTARRKVLRQRRRRRRTLIVFTLVATICTFATGAAYVYLQNRFWQIERLDLATLAGDSPGAVMNVLLVGSDSRANLGGAETDIFGKNQAPGPRSDTIMILHVDPRAEKAAIVSVPRDLYVPISGGGYTDRVSIAFALGGADQLIATIQGALGVTINHYIQVDFAGFKGIVDAVGGVTLYLPYPVRDPVSGLALDREGCIELDGNQALSWVRSGQMELLKDGTWQPDGRGDLGRAERQQDFIRRMLRTTLPPGVANPMRLNRVIGAGVRDVTFDSSLSTTDLSALGRWFSSLDPDRVVLRTLPAIPVDIGGRSVQTLQLTQAQPILDLLNGKPFVEVTPTTVASPPPPTTATTAAGGLKASDVRVRVLNGVGTPGAAAKAATSLTSLGFTVADKGDAPSISAKTTILYGTGQLTKAQLLQGALVAPAVLREDATLKAVDVNLVLGGDYTGVKSGISSGASAASTTLASPATTVAARATTPPC